MYLMRLNGFASLKCHSSLFSTQKTENVDDAQLSFGLKCDSHLYGRDESELPLEHKV